MAAKDSLGANLSLGRQLSYLQARSSTLSRNLSRSSFRSRARLSDATIEETARAMHKLSKRSEALRVEVKSNSDSVTLTSEATQHVFAMIRQSDVVLDKVPEVLTRAELEHLCGFMLAVASTFAVMLQCLRHAQLLLSFR